MNHSSGSREYDAGFISRLQQQDPAAFKTLFEDFAGIVFARAVIFLGDSASAEDAAQEVFYKAYMSLANLKDAGVKPWLMTITRNHCLDILRRKKSRPCCVDVPIDNYGKKPCEPQSDIHEILAVLPEEIRVPLMFKVIEGLKYKEIAEILNKPEGSLRNLVCKGLKILRKEIPDEL
ncbi:MAG: RNA polymerase sigma factor [Candidatus Riflebacteria bacterium]|nr:RNA polymerase sigma factor [Candidatus Riflebacteria bacterium]